MPGASFTGGIYLRVPAQIGDHLQTRSKFVNQLYELSFSVSYKRVDDIARFSDICLRPFQVCWCCLLITVEAIDNLNHDPSSTMAQGSLHESQIGFF